WCFSTCSGKWCARKLFQWAFGPGRNKRLIAAEQTTSSTGGFDYSQKTLAFHKLLFYNNFEENIIIKQ
ncbi:hypothetical protein ACTGUZ_02210, partial [Streptococcus suis]|uniref:hypothetical protein n=1 Tax=Streptococcus sp. 2021WUSS109 TaxID=2983282 RepID=UPI0037D1A047